MNAQINKEAGLYTQIRTLRKRIDSLDMTKVDPSELKAAIDSLRDLETRYADMQEKKKQRSLEKQNKEKELASQTVVSEEVKPEVIPVEAAPAPVPVEAIPVEATPEPAPQPVPEIDTKPEEMEPKKADESVEKLDKAEPAEDPEFDSMIAQALYMKMLSYLVMEEKPEHEVIVKFRKAIERVQNEEDREKLKEVFNKEFAGDQKTPWDYYAETEKAGSEIKSQEVKAETSKFALDDVVEPVYGSAGSYGRVMRYDADKDMAYVHWDGGKLQADHGFGAYKGSDLRKRAASEKQVCYDCQTSPRTDCPKCGGTGWVEKKASIDVISRVVERTDGWHVLSEEGKNLGGPYKSKEQAVKRLRQVEYFKHHKGSLKEALQDNDTPETVRKQWDEAAPHFGGGMPHRWDDDVKDAQGKNRCSYCWRPADYQPGSPVRPEEIEELRQVMGSENQADDSLKVKDFTDPQESDPNENPGEGYGGDRPGIAVAPKASKKEAAKLNVANRVWEVVPKYDLSTGGTKLLGYDIYADTGELAGKIKTTQPLNQQVLEQEIWNQLGKSGSVYAVLKTNLSVLKKGHKVKIVSVDVKRKEAKFASTEIKSISGWTKLDSFDFLVEAKKTDHTAELMPLSKSNVVRVKSFKVLSELAEKCPDCYKKFLKFAKEKGLHVQADDLSDHVEQIKTKINQTKEVLQQQTVAAESGPAKLETEADLPPKPNIQLPMGMKWMYNMDTNTWDMVADSQFTY